MGHLIDMTTGKAAIAYRGVTPWHQLGTEWQEGWTLEDWAKNAGLDWNAVMVQGGAYVGDQWRPVDDHFHVMRSDTEAMLGAFTGRYKPVQPVEVLQFFQQFIGVDERYQLEVAGALRGGAQIWALARFNNPEGLLKVAGDTHEQFVCLSTSFDGSLATTASATAIRVVCNNTLSANQWAIKRGDAAAIKVRHSTEFNERRRALTLKQLADATASFERYKELGDGLAKVAMSRDDVAKLFKKLLDIPEGDLPKDVSKRKANTFEEMVRAFVTSEMEAGGVHAGTAWAALNAVTRFVDHERNTRVMGHAANQNEARLHAANFGNGALMKANAVKLLAAQYQLAA